MEIENGYASQTLNKDEKRQDLSELIVQWGYQYLNTFTISSIYSLPAIAVKRHIKFHLYANHDFHLHLNEEMFQYVKSVNEISRWQSCLES